MEIRHTEVSFNADVRGRPDIIVDDTLSLRPIRMTINLSSDDDGHWDGLEDLGVVLVFGYFVRPDGTRLPGAEKRRYTLPWEEKSVVPQWVKDDSVALMKEQTKKISKSVESI